MTGHSALFQNIRYYAVYQLMYVSAVVLLTSSGAFFHFLLDHEISIVESWLHNNHWEILIISKLFSLFLLNRWFSVRLYEFRSVRDLIKDLVRWPEPKAIVISLFMVTGLLAMGRPVIVSQNFNYWYNHFASFFGLFLYFGIEFIVIVYLDDILNQKVSPHKFWLGLAYIATFAVAYRLSTPDYYNLLNYVVFCY